MRAVAAEINPELHAGGSAGGRGSGRGRRDRLRAVITDLGRTPVATEEGYAVDADDRSGAHLASVALETEERCADVYAQLVASTVGDQRRWAVEALTDASLRSLTFGGKPETWPGAPEL